MAETATTKEPAMPRLSGGCSAMRYQTHEPRPAKDSQDWKPAYERLPARTRPAFREHKSRDSARGFLTIGLTEVDVGWFADAKINREQAVSRPAADHQSAQLPVGCGVQPVDVEGLGVRVAVDVVRARVAGSVLDESDGIADGVQVDNKRADLNSAAHFVERPSKEPVKSHL
jgi:hypothetical protein